jgi:hypothetical protein
MSGENTNEVPILYNMDAKKRVMMDEWVLSNRPEFIQFINTNFIEQIQQASRDMHYFWDESTEPATLTPIAVFKHQQFISDFLQENSPYRGCLLYYGLGSGKTLSSINVAEGMNRQVIVLLPASLSSNFKEDLSKKGNSIYHLENHWQFMRIDNYKLKTEQEKLQSIGFPVDNSLLMDQLYMVSGTMKKRGGGFWTIVRGNTQNNYDSFTPDEKFQIRQTVETLTNYKYKFFNYNGGAGIVAKIMREILVDERNHNVYDDIESQVYRELFGASSISVHALPKPDKQKLKNTILSRIYRSTTIANPFDNKLVIIDEVHNLMSRICNGSQNSLILYEMILRAKNCRIVALSGTPIINSPFELSILFNLLKGYTTYYKLYLGNTPNKVKLETALQQNEHIDRYIIDSQLRYVEITRYPHGYVKQSSPDYKTTVVRNTEYDKMTDVECIELLREQFLQDGIVLSTTADYTIENLSIFPDIFIKKTPTDRWALDIETAKNTFYDLYVDKSSSEIKNIDEFKYRSLGVVSFYNEKSDIDRQVFPDKIYDPKNPDWVEVSDYQLVKYEEMRKIERVKEKPRKSSDVIKDMTLNIESTVNNLFKVFSRQSLLFTFPPNIKRAMMRDYKNVVKDCADIAEECDLTEKLDENAYAADLRRNIAALTVENLTVNSTEQYNLSVLSPKYTRLLTNISATPGLVFGYSQYRSVEGIEIFKRVLDCNGYRLYDAKDLQPISIGTKVRYEIDASIKKWVTANVISVPSAPSASKTVSILIESEGGRIIDDVPLSQVYICYYALWTGTESIEQRSEIMSVYKHSRNMFGQRLLILLTTSSGSEGINLKYVRQVHIMEPYWNKVRIEQVIGRARRIESHAGLPVEQMNVRVFEYVSRFSESQMKGEFADINSQLQQQILRGIASDDYITSDQLLLQISDRKFGIISKFLNAIKTISIDCAYNREENVLSDPTLEQCVPYKPGSEYAFNPKKNPSPHETNLREKVSFVHETRKGLYPLIYRNDRGQIFHVLYQIPLEYKLDELPEDTILPVYNFYTYYGINPTLRGFGKPATKALIGSIRRNPETGRLRLVLDYRFTKDSVVNYYLQAEQCILRVLKDGETIPQFTNERDRVIFTRRVQKQLEKEPVLGDDVEPELEHTAQSRTQPSASATSLRTGMRMKLNIKTSQKRPLSPIKSISASHTAQRPASPIKKLPSAISPKKSLLSKKQSQLKVRPLQQREEQQYFEHQKDPLSCGRHALNHLLGGEFFTFSDTQKARETPLDLDTPPICYDSCEPKGQVNLQQLCYTMKKKHALLVDQPTHDAHQEFTCLKSENYNESLLRVALCIFNYKMAGTYVDKDDILTYIRLHDREWKLLVNEGGSVQGGHWVAYCKYEHAETVYYYNSLFKEVRTFDNIGEFARYCDTRTQDQFYIVEEYETREYKNPLHEVYAFPHQIMVCPEYTFGDVIRLKSEKGKFYYIERRFKDDPDQAGVCNGIRVVKKYINGDTIDPATELERVSTDRLKGSLLEGFDDNDIVTYKKKQYIIYFTSTSKQDADNFDEKPTQHFILYELGSLLEVSLDELAQ